MRIGVEALFFWWSPCSQPHLKDEGDPSPLLRLISSPAWLLCSAVPWWAMPSGIPFQKSPLPKPSMYRLIMLPFVFVVGLEDLFTGWRIVEVC